MMNGEDKTRFTVDIFGNSYKMVGSHNERYMKQLAGFVNEHMERVAKSNPRLDTLKVAILALVNMADDCFQLRQQGMQADTERAQAKLRIEELRKAFELSEEKERTKTQECQRLMEQVEALEKERDQLVQEIEKERVQREQELESERLRLGQELESERLQLGQELAHERTRLGQELESERTRLEQELEMSSAAWAERVTEWEAKYGELEKHCGQLIQEVEVAREVAAASLVAAANMELDSQEVSASAEGEDSVEKPDQLQVKQLTVGIPEEISSEEKDLQEKYNKLQEEYIKLQNEFNEWIQLTQSQTQ